MCVAVLTSASEAARPLKTDSPFAYVVDLPDDARQRSWSVLVRRDEVLHVARAAARIAGVTNVVIVGSRTILGAYHEEELPSPVLASIEADVLVLHDVDGTAVRSISGAIGQMSMSHRENDYNADGWS